MNAQSRMRAAVLGGTMILAMLAGCRPAGTFSEANFAPGTLSEDAQKTLANYIHAVNAGEEKIQDEIPSKYWAASIKALHPIKVYMHIVNVVVVQRINNGIEEGKYIYIPISSYLPRSGDDGFEFTPDPAIDDTYLLGNGVFDFKRTSHQ